ncbi:hypothetical protein KoPa4_00058 [Pseudomonas phage vB_PpuM-KoPa-4]|uniref:Uncharacterized protein n=1 Tax=Pseudomonas phage vB_PpuM-KoPa-4 TaxID=3132618 RepID=A0AAX4MWT2_9CAUD
MYKVECEWDIGIGSDTIFRTVDDAWECIDQLWDDEELGMTSEEAQGEGLLHITALEVWGE